jgi:Ser/Thr protein kinase RdoA (MazF antagonist)
VHTALIADVAIAAVANITNIEALETDLTDFVCAYHEVEPLLPEELAILNWLIAGRIVTGVLIPSWHRARNPAAKHFDDFSVEHIDRRIALVEALTSAPPLTLPR